MKDRILNLFMLLTVAAALIFTLVKAPPEGAAGGTAPFRTALPAPSPSPTPEPLDAYRSRRAESRCQEQAALAVLIENENTAGEIRRLAEAQLLEMTAHSEAELAVEAALTARGYEKALCVVRADAVNVFLSQEISAQDAALILALAREASGAAPENIRIAGL